MNGGKCEEQCKSPKVKFTCTCTDQYEGKVCQTRRHFASCRDALNNLPHGTLKDGLYAIQRPDNKKRFMVFCEFDTKKNKTWVVIESFALKNKELFVGKPFFTNFSMNQHDSELNWEAYRLALEDMQYFIANCTYFRSTCSYEKRSLGDALENDVIIGQLAQTDIFYSSVYHVCKEFTECSINGKIIKPCTARLYHQNGMHIHIDPWPRENPGCTFKYSSAVAGADFFGFYKIVDPLFKCTATQGSTTQWWLGD